MKSHFTAEFFKNNRHRLRNALNPEATIILTANGLLQRSNDSTYAFRQDSNFLYLTGISEPDIILVMHNKEEYFIVPERSDTRETFDGGVSADQLCSISGVGQSLGEKEGWQKLSPILQQTKQVWGLVAPPSYIAAHGMYTNPARRKLANEIKRLNASLELIDIRSQLAQLRVIKQPGELQAIQTSIDLSLASFSHVRSELASFENECDVEAMITSDFKKANACHAYSPIIAAGPHACTLHYIANNGKLNNNDILLIDAGAEVEGYAADITRSYMTKKPPRRQQAVHQAVINVQQYAKSLLKPGVLLREYEKAVELFMGQELQKLKLINKVQTQEVRHYYPHATSHFLGLDVHDVGDYEKPLKEGMVLTVEPGIYIPEEGIGIRIEDDVLISKNGIRVLSDKLSRDL